MLLYGLHNSWVGFRLRRTAAGGRLIQLWLDGFCYGSQFALYGLQLRPDGFCYGSQFALYGLQLRPECTDCWTHFGLVGVHSCRHLLACVLSYWRSFWPAEVPSSVVSP
jgi:hypothetical protein